MELKCKYASRRVSCQYTFRSNKYLANKFSKLVNIIPNKYKNVKSTYNQKAKVCCDLYYKHTTDSSKPV